MQGAGFRIEIPLVPQERIGFVRDHARRAAELLLRAVEVEERELVLLRRRPVHLGVRILQDRLVLGLRQTDDLDVVLPVRSPEPQLVLEQRPADVEAPVENLIRVVRLVRAHQPRIAGERPRQVRRLQAVVVERELGAARELVGAAPGHEVDPEAAGLHFQIVAAGRDRHLVEGVEVVIRRGRAPRRRVGDDDAVQVPHRVGGQRALADKTRLLARFVAADVHPVDDDAGHGLQQRPRILRLRRALQLVLGERGDRPHLLHVDDRRFRRDGHGFFDRLHRQRERYVGAHAGVHDHIALHPIEADEIRRHFVRAGVQVEEPELPLRVGDRRARLSADCRRGERHVDAGQDRTLLIGDGAVDVAAGDLCAGARHEHTQQQRRRHGEHSLHTGAPLIAQGPTLNAQTTGLRGRRVES